MVAAAVTPEESGDRNTMSDHYELLGIDRDANKDEIRGAFQDRKSELSDGVDDREQLGRLNEAWQTLADPYQRGRYDAALDATDAVGMSEDVEIVEDELDEPPRRRGFFAPPDPDERKRATAAAQPTIDLPAGIVLAENRSRINAMLFDLAIVILFVLGAQLIGEQIVNSQYPDQTDQIAVLVDEVEWIEDEQDRRDDLADDLASTDEQVASAEAAGESTAELEARQAELLERQRDPQADESFAIAEIDARLAIADLDEAARAELEAERDFRVELLPPVSDSQLETQREALVDESSDLNSELSGTRLAALGIGVVLGVAYLVGFGVRRGQTPGKRLRKVRVLAVDGSRAPFGATFVRYALPAGFAVLTLQILGIFGVALAMMGVLLWMRNPNKQGLHDRAAKTIVVEVNDASDAAVRKRSESSGPIAD